MSFTFDKQKSQKITFLKEEIAKITGDNPSHMEVYLSSTYRYEREIKDDEDINDVRKNKYRTVIIRPIPLEE